MRDRDCNVGIGAIGALQAIEPAAATALLCDVLADTTLVPAVRTYAAEKLRHAERTARAVEVLEQAAADTNENLRKAACLALGRPVPDTFFNDLPRAIDIRRRDWVGLPMHVNPATCDDSAFVPIPPGTYALAGTESVQGQTWVILVQGSARYKLDGGDFRAHWPTV